MVSPAEAADAADAVKSLAPMSLAQLRDVLRPCMAKSADDVRTFDAAFDEYFLRDERVAALAAAAVCWTEDEKGRRSGSGAGLRARSRSSAGSADGGLRSGPGESSGASSELPRPDGSGGEEAPPQENASGAGKEGGFGRNAERWREALQGDPAVPESLKKFVRGDRFGAAAALAGSPLTDADKREIAAAAARLSAAGALDEAGLEGFAAELERFARMAAAVERRRRGLSASRVEGGTASAFGARREPGGFAPGPAWEWDAAIPEHLLKSRLEKLDARALARLTEEIERAAAALRPLLQRSPGTARRRLAADYRETLRLSLSTFGEPFRIVFAARRRKPRRIVTVCDVSGSVKKVAGLMLAFMYGLHRAFEGRARHFIFVSEVDEVTPYFSLGSYEECFDRVTCAAAVDYYGYSDYGKALTLLWERHRDAFDHETVAVFLGDARTNRRDPKAGVLAELAARVRKAFFLNPEDPSEWGTGDSAAHAYRRVVEMRDASRLEGLVAFLKSLSGMVAA
jgi:uncharacterized protein with von Willebrand factor type A (vWA) domain